MLVIYWPQKIDVTISTPKYTSMLFLPKKGLTTTKQSLIKDQVIGEDQVK